MKIAIIGTGLIGKKRALSLPSGVKLDVVCNRSEEKGEKFAKGFNCRYESDWRKVVTDKSIDAIIIATSHDSLTSIAVAAIKNRKHVLVEKPGARNFKEFEKIIKAHKKNPFVVMFGYNHRYHPSIQKAKEIIDSKKYGKVMFVRSRYGHGARLGYEKEWRFQKEISGGGELIDQGPHLIDLVNYLVAPMTEVVGFTPTLFWKTKADDSAFFIMKNKKNQFAQLSVTCVEWKNIFSFELMLTKAKIQIDGLGGSYGKEKLTLYKMRPEMGPPDVEKFEFSGEDLSWKKENEVFFQRIKNKDYSTTAINDAYYVLKIIDKIYNQV